jgi:hypothetical protein
MTASMKRLLLLVLLAGAAWAFFAWPRLSDVTTGQTKEYPDLQDKSYATSETRVAEAAKTAVARLSGWTFKGAGTGPGGFALQAERKDRLGFVYEVTVRMQREGGRTRVRVRSRSRTGKIDFGQNARNIRELLAALDEAMR